MRFVANVRFSGRSQISVLSARGPLLGYTPCRPTVGYMRLSAHGKSAVPPLQVTLISHQRAAFVL